MSSWLTSLLRPLLAATLLGATLGGLGAVGFFFWQNREMCPCAPVGLSEGEQAVAAPMTLGVRRGVWQTGLVGAGVGLLAAVFWVVPPALRLRRATLDES